MLYEHAMMFHLSTPTAVIEQALADAKMLVKQPLRNVEVEKRRERIRDVGNCLVRVAAFEFEGDETMMEAMRERLWEAHDGIVSTLTIPHSTHERRSRYAPRRWEAAVDDWHRVGEDRPAYLPEVAPPPQPIAPEDRFSREALLRRYDQNLDKPKRVFNLRPPK